MKNDLQMSCDLSKLCLEMYCLLVWNVVYYIISSTYHREDVNLLYEY